MKKAVLALFLLTSTASATPVPGLNDYGELLLPNVFSEHCVISDPGISGSRTIDAYTHGQISCSELQTIYNNVYIQARAYLKMVNFDMSMPAAIKTLHLRIVTLAELNNPNNFSQTDYHCMYNVRCSTGAYFGRTFYSSSSSNINTYIVFTDAHIDWKFSFIATVEHELMHAILYRYQWNVFSANKEHALIDGFLTWCKKK